MKVPPELLSFFKEEDKFFIATHINPEGDALGSSLALSIALETLGKSTLLYDRDPVPEFYTFLPGYEKFIRLIPDITPSTFNLVLLDCNTLDRAGINKGLHFRYSTVIDHHETETDFGSTRWVEPEAAATGLMIFYLLKGLGLHITREIAINLYSAIAIDTGAFRYSNTSAEVLRVTAELVDAGASPSSIATSLYESWSEKRFRLFAMTLNTLEIREKIAFTFVTKDMFKKTGASPEDTESFSSYPRKMKDIKISSFFRETNTNEWKVSLRSKGEINVAEIALGFGGGGHKNAAGFRIKGNLESVKETLLNQIRHIFQASGKKTV